MSVSGPERAVTVDLSRKPHPLLPRFWDLVLESCRVHTRIQWYKDTFAKNARLHSPLEDRPVWLVGVSASGAADLARRMRDDGRAVDELKLNLDSLRCELDVERDDPFMAAARAWMQRVISRHLSRAFDDAAWLWLEIIGAGMDAAAEQDREFARLKQRFGDNRRAYGNRPRFGQQKQCGADCLLCLLTPFFEHGSDRQLHTPFASDREQNEDGKRRCELVRQHSAYKTE